MTLLDTPDRELNQSYRERAADLLRRLDFWIYYVGQSS